MTEDYHPPVSHLLALGDAWRKERPDYLTEFGFTEADLPELRRLLFDERFYNDDESPAGWGYIHAMYVLGELRTEEALQTLIEAATRLTEHDGLWATIPEPLSQMGAAALPHLAAAFRRHRQSYERATPFSRAIAMIGQRDPAAQPEAVATLMALLEEHEHNALDLNATLIDGLIDLRAEHSLPLIQSAYEAGHVDDDIVTWEGVQIAFGLKEGMTDLDKYRDLLARVEQGRADGDAENVPFAEPRQARAPKSDAGKIRKKKRKAEKQARKKNRKKR